MRDFKIGDSVKVVNGGARGRVEWVRTDTQEIGVRHGVKDIHTYHLFNVHFDYPELNSVAQGLAGVIMSAINSIVPHVTSEMPYKAQYVLEEVIAELQKRV